MARSTARKRALNTLYEADEKGQDIESLLQERIKRPGAQTPLPEYAIQIVHGVAKHFDDINRILNERSTSWPVRRMAVIDRNILRIACWEMLYNPEIPSKVAIDEALTLAKTLCDSDTPAFVHGLLSAVERDQPSLEEDADAARKRAEEAARISDLAEAEAAQAEAKQSEAAESETEGSDPGRAEGAQAEASGPAASETAASQAEDAEAPAERPDEAASPGASLDDLSLELPPELG
ncbi:transcription antitermination factor NusB [Bifidobacterium actinocoloniiforme DSM 22766]|uniref:Transcription antitermination protein NusB n=1 Tax=Bifidobacterium actinocoloniiforme DSM 22766 TaxID=1437605 RepID=A0A086Z191_9BIFI|nr:transcription antitermination factor NusB [Bifidobacterium actinocoloniiforme]KFI40291.1 transcription antitermination factor NusB [Bifidobacterium actinocoloniiforme DSM 22766]